MHCDYFDAGLCRSCTRMGEDYPSQLARKSAHVRDLLRDHPGIEWLEPAASPESGFRNKAKMVVAGTAEHPTLGILDRAGRGIDLTGCGLYPPEILEALPRMRDFVAEHRLTPYDVPARRGELKHLLVTVSPDGELMVRFVLRSKKLLVPIRRGLDALREDLPTLRVASANLLREHQALLEGPEEILLTEQQTLPMRLNGIEMHLRPQGFFQTNTDIAAAMYRQGADWLREAAPRSLWDLYCGVGGFALHAARALAGERAEGPGDGPRVTGIEISTEAVAAARRSAADLGLHDVEFLAGDAPDWARRTGTVPEAVVVNPPRRGIGPDLAAWLEDSGIRTVVYSSCHPKSLAADLAAMPSLEPVAARLLDMFPQTDHCETMVLLRRT